MIPSTHQISHQDSKLNREMEHDIAVSQNYMFAEDVSYEDDDYAYNKQRRAKMESRKLTALVYDTSKHVRKVAQNSLQPILKEKGRAATLSLSRATKLFLQDSAKADLRLTELYRTTIEEFKKKLSDQKHEAMLSRINLTHKSEVDGSKVIKEVKKEESSALKKHKKRHAKSMLN